MISIFSANSPKWSNYSFKFIKSESFIFHLQVNNTDVSNMGHTEVVNLVRAAPRVVDLVVGRVLEAPKPPIEAHLLPDICFKGSQEPLGKNQLSLTRSNIPNTSEAQTLYILCS